MAVTRKDIKSYNCVQLISEIDDAINMEESDWEAYQEDYDESKLSFVPDMVPTRFVCNFELSGKHAAKIKNAMIGGRDDDGQPKIALGDWAFRVAKLTLKDVKNPDDVPEADRFRFKKDKDGFAHDDLLTQLDRLGIVSEIFQAYNTLIEGSHRKQAKN